MNRSSSHHQSNHRHHHQLEQQGQSQSIHSPSAPSPSNTSPSKTFATSLAAFNLAPPHTTTNTTASQQPLHQHSTTASSYALSGAASASPIPIPSKPATPQPSPLTPHAKPTELLPASSSPLVGLGFAPAGPSSHHHRGAPAGASPTLPPSGWGSPSTFLRRSAATAAATAAAAAGGSASVDSPNFGQLSPVKKGASRLRRSSMLGREITPFELDDDVPSHPAPGLASQAPKEKQIGFAPMRHTFSSAGTDGEHAVVEGRNSMLAPSAAARTDDDVDMDEDSPAVAAAPPAQPPSTPPPPQPGSLARFSSSESGGPDNGTSRTGSDSPSLAQPSPGGTTATTASGSASFGNRSRSGSNVARSTLAGSLVTKRAVNRRANLMPKDRGVLRVAATLQDEKKPEDSEIASEAKLQKRLGGDPSIPRTPRLGGIAGGGKMRSPFHGARGFAGCAGSGSGGFASVGRRGRWGWDDDDYDALDMDGIGNDDGSDSSSEEDMAAVAAGSSNQVVGGAESDEERAMRDDEPIGSDVGAPASTISEGVSSLPKHRKGSLWMGFRESRANHHRASPGNERLLRSRTPGHALPLELETSPKSSMMMSAAHSPGPWTRSSKRKMISGEDRYEPYATSAYKRRAVSPMTLLNTSSIGGAGAGGAGTSLTSPSLLASQHFQQHHFREQQPLPPQSGNAGTAVSALPTPVSMPSPTHTFSTSASPAAPFGAYFSGMHYKPSQLGSRATTPGGGTAAAAAAAMGSGRSSRSRAGSPSVISRPATPVSRAVTASGILHNYANAVFSTSAGAGGSGGAGGAQPLTSPSLLSTSLGSALGGSGGGLAGGAGGNAAAARNTGSGPGYGSGALGLSISGNSASVPGIGGATGSSVNGGGGGLSMLSTSMNSGGGGGGGGGLFGVPLVGAGAGGAGLGAAAGGGWLSGIGVGVGPGGYNDDELEGEEMDEGVRMLGLG